MELARAVGPQPGRWPSMPPAHVLALQRVVGNATVQRLLAPSSGPTVQRAEVAVAGGTFKDDAGDGYIPYNVKEPDEANWQHGAQMSQLEFRPAVGVTNGKGERATEVSLVQTTNSDVKQKGQVGEVEDQPESLLNERRTEAGASIDQQIYLAPTLKTDKFDLHVERLLPLMEGIRDASGSAENNKRTSDFIDLIQKADYQQINSQRSAILQTKLEMILKNERAQLPAAVRIVAVIPEAVKILKSSRKNMNLDPRYAEERSSSAGPMRPSRAAGALAQGTTGWNARRPGGTDPWPGAAVLRDRPAHTVARGTELEGQEVFEVAAMADGDKFVGSINWGWKIDGVTSELVAPTITKADDGGSSAEFMEASAAWNEMEVADLRDPTLKHRPMQLPTTKPATMKVLLGKVEAEADAIVSRMNGGLENPVAAEVTATRIREHAKACTTLARMVEDDVLQAEVVDQATKIGQAGMRYRTGARLPDREKGAEFADEAWRMVVDSTALFDLYLHKALL